jgi:hypothetical protein
MMESFCTRHKRTFVWAVSTILLISFLGLDVAVATSFAQDSESVEKAGKSAPVVPELEPVVVTGTTEVDASGKSSYDKDTILALPSGNGNVGDLLKFMPGVQAADASNTSFQGGDIIPPLLSISGGRPYQNNFLIDGMGNNSLIDPIEDNPHKIDRLPGHPEEIFLNARLVKSVTVYDNNIPVRFGGFTGGVVDVETIDPADRPGGTVHYKTTRDEWTEFHVAPSDQAAFDQSTTYFRQPEFTKHLGGFDLSLPTGTASGFLLSYQFVYSEIPLVFLDTKRDQTRLNQNFLLKFVSKPTLTDKITLQMIYSPYEAGYFVKDTRNGDFTLKGGGVSLLANYEMAVGDGTLDLRVGARRSENSRKAPKDYFYWANSTNKNWGSLIGSSFSKEGGFGDLDILQDSYEANVDWLSGVIRAGNIFHQLSAGLHLLHTRGTYDRDETSYSYRTSVTIVPTVPPDPLSGCGTDTVACVPAEQYLSKRSIYGESHTQANLNRYAFYLEDLINISRLELRPGVRVSYDDLMENVDVAPRLAATYDLFGNGRSKLIGGWNRYYGDTLLLYKLREGIARFASQTRVTVIDNDIEWGVPVRVPTTDQFSELKTPLVDEIVAGFEQYMWGGVAGFRYVRRDGKDEFAKEKDPVGTIGVRYTRLNNNGKSHYESYRLSWERHWPTQFLNMNVSYNKSTSTNGDYDDSLLLDDLDEMIWYDGKLLYPDELPQDGFNRHLVASLLYSVDMLKGFRFTNTTHFRSGYRNIEDGGGDELVNGIPYPKYEEVKRPSSTIFDWRIDWVPPAIPERALTLTLEIYNLLNKRTYVGAATDRYELGRQFWVGAEYKF